MEFAMTILEGWIPSFLVDWTPLKESGYSERHALLFRLSGSIQKTIQEALRDRRLKMTTSRFLGGHITLWKDNRDFRFREHIELVDDISQAFARAFWGNCPWKLIVVDKKNLALLVCDSLLFPVLAEAANICSNTRFLRVPAVCGTHRARSSGTFETHFFHQDPSALKMIAVKCATSVERVLLTLLIQSLRNLEEDFAFLLHLGFNAYAFESLPRDPVACLRHCTHVENQGNLDIDASASKVASVTFINGNLDNNLLWHMSSSSHHIGLSINVVNSSTEGVIVSLSSNLLRKTQLESFNELFHSSLTYLLMTLRLTWPDEAQLDPKLRLHFETLCKSLTCRNNPHGKP